MARSKKKKKNCERKTEEKKFQRFEWNAERAREKMNTVEYAFEVLV